jgi:integrase
MTGWIITRTAKDGSKRYDASWRVGGRIKSKTFARKKDAARYLTDTVKRVHDGTYRELTPTNFKAYAEKWLGGLSGLKPSTIREYRSAMIHNLIPAFGEQPIGSLTVTDVNAYIAKRQGILKPKTLRNHLALLHRFFEDAVDAGHLAVNRLHASRSLRRPKALRPEDEGEVEILDASEVNRLLDKIAAHYVPLYVTLVSTGMRLGEALGLQFGDIDWNAQQIRIRRSLWKGEYYLPKSKKSRRSIDIGDQVLGALRGVQRGRYDQAEPPGDAPVFVTTTGAIINPDNLRHRVWEPALAAATLRHVTMHSLRHTYASLMIAQGENIKYISEQMGHASIQITVDRYGHLFPSTKREAPARLEAQLAEGRKLGAPALHTALIQQNGPENAKTPESTVNVEGGVSAEDDGET